MDGFQVDSPIFFSLPPVNTYKTIYDTETIVVTASSLPRPARKTRPGLNKIAKEDGKKRQPSGKGATISIRYLNMYGRQKTMQVTMALLFLAGVFLFFAKLRVRSVNSLRRKLSFSNSPFASSATSSAFLRSNGMQFTLDFRNKILGEQNNAPVRNKLSNVATGKSLVRQPQQRLPQILPGIGTPPQNTAEEYIQMQWREAVIHAAQQGGKLSAYVICSLKENIKSRGFACGQGKERPKEQLRNQWNRVLKYSLGEDNSLIDFYPSSILELPRKALRRMEAKLVDEVFAHSSNTLKRALVHSAGLSEHVPDADNAVVDLMVAAGAYRTLASHYIDDAQAAS